MAATVVLVDQVAKALAVAKLSDRAPLTLVPHVLQLHLIRNAGAAFGVAQGGTLVLSVIALTVVAVIVRSARTLQSTPWAVALGLLLGGAVGNLIDRMVRSPGLLRGHVVDFLEFPHFPIFNGADSAITVGACLMVLLSFRGSSSDASAADVDHLLPGARADG